MKTVVADASALIDYIVPATGAEVGALAEVITSSDVHVPALCDLEFCAFVRRDMMAGRVTESRALEALDDYLALPITRHGHEALLPAVWDLRENFTAYDAAYVALASALDAELLTTDRSLARAARKHVRIA